MPLEVGTISTMETGKWYLGAREGSRNALRSRDNFNQPNKFRRCSYEEVAMPLEVGTISTNGKEVQIGTIVCRNALRSRDNFNSGQTTTIPCKLPLRRNALRSRDNFNSPSLVLEYQPIHFPKSPISDRPTLKIA